MFISLNINLQRLRLCHSSVAVVHVLVTSLCPCYFVLNSFPCYGICVSFMGWTAGYAFFSITYSWLASYTICGFYLKSILCCTWPCWWQARCRRNIHPDEITVNDSWLRKWFLLIERECGISRKPTMQLHEIAVWHRRRACGYEPVQNTLDKDCARKAYFSRHWRMLIWHVFASIQSINAKACVFIWDFSGMHLMLQHQLQPPPTRPWNYKNSSYPSRRINEIPLLFSISFASVRRKCVEKLRKSDSIKDKRTSALQQVMSLHSRLTWGFANKWIIQDKKEVRYHLRTTQNVVLFIKKNLEEKIMMMTLQWSFRSIKWVKPRWRKSFDSRFARAKVRLLISVLKGKW